MLIKNQSLKSYNTFAIDATAAYFVKIKSIKQLQDLCCHQIMREMPSLVLGGGSNVLLAHDYAGVVVKNEINGIEIIKKNAQSVWLNVGAGVPWHELVQYSLDNDFAGLENLSLIPGTVGAAPIQNIGAYGVEFQSVFESLTAVEKATGKLKVFDAAECQFGYRTSIFKQELKNKYIIVDVTVRLNKAGKNLQLHYDRVQDTLDVMGVKKPTIQDVSAAVIQLRQSKLPDPNKIGNAGSFFKNPEVSLQHANDLKQQFSRLPVFPIADDRAKISAAVLIESAGWKGKHHGGAAVSDQHALVLVNYNNATGAELLQLSQAIQHDIKQRYAVQLIPEVYII